MQNRDTEMQTRDSAEEQAWLIERMIAAGSDAKIVEDGVCSGLNRAAILLSILMQNNLEKPDNGIKLFNQLLIGIQQLPTLTMVEKIQIAEEKQTLSAPLDVEDVFLLSITPFFKLICELQDIDLHKEDFPTEAIFSLIDNIPLVHDQHIEKPETMIVQIDLVTGIYTDKDLLSYFTIIHGIYKEFFERLSSHDEERQALPNLILWLGNSQHFTSILLNDIWTIINANKDDVISTSVDDNEVAIKTADAFSGNGITTYATRLFCAPQHENLMRTFYAYLQQHAEWKRIHAITHKKALMKDDTGTTWLHLAALENDSEVVKNLIREGAKINKGDEEDYTPMHCAAGENSIEAIEELIKNKAKLNCPTMHGGVTPLIIAASLENEKVLKLLLESGAKPNVKNDEQKVAAEYISDTISPRKGARIMSIFRMYHNNSIDSDPDSVSPMSSPASNSETSSPFAGSGSEGFFTPTKKSFTPASSVYSGLSDDMELDDAHDDDDFDTDDEAAQTGSRPYTSLNN